MYMYLWKYLPQVSDNYHSGGGAIVIAENEEQAKYLIDQDPTLEVDADDWKDVLVYEMAKHYASNIIIFPDAGCC